MKPVTPFRAALIASVRSNYELTCECPRGHFFRLQGEHAPGAVLAKPRVQVFAPTELCPRCQGQEGFNTRTSIMIEVWESGRYTYSAVIAENNILSDEILYSKGTT